MREVRGGASRSWQSAERLIALLPLVRNHPPNESRMQKKLTRFYVALVILLPLTAFAQEKQRFATMDEASQAGAILAGRQGPRNVNWIEGGKRFSYIDRDARTGTDTLRHVRPS